jgi:uncharacterized protein (DUF302 family)
MKHRLATFFVLVLAAGPVLAQQVIRYARTEARFDEVRDDLKQAIESRGFVVDYQAQIGKMLDRTGKDLGTTDPIFTDAQSLQFCGAQLSRKLMKADPANAAMCPFTLVVYATAKNPGQVVVAYRRPVRIGSNAASGVALLELDGLLDSIAREATGRPARR